MDGQLNALVLPERPGGAFSWFAYDGLPTATALDPQAPSADSVNIRWGRNARCRPSSALRLPASDSSRPFLSPFPYHPAPSHFRAGFAFQGAAFSPRAVTPLPPCFWNPAVSDRSFLSIGGAL